MIELQKKINFNRLISEYLVQRRSGKKIPSTSPDNQNVKVLTQEKDGAILYTWDDVSDASEGAIVTHFGLYEPVSQKHQVVHTYNQRVNVVSCSINQERTLMAFTVLSREVSGTGEKRSFKEKYSAYLAEVKALSPRVFSLNLERGFFLKVQFLYEGRSQEKETNMLVMLHRESIGLYKIPLARMGKGMVMRGQPNTKQVAKKFIWCQWDAANQQLFYVHFRRDGEGDKQAMLSNTQFYDNAQYENVWDAVNQQLFYVHFRRDGEGDKQAMLSNTQFYDNAQYENVLDVPLNFPFHTKSSARSNYEDIPFHTGIPDPSINACVLTQSNGTFCICYQQRVFTTERRSAKSSPLPRLSPLHRTSPMPRTSPFMASPDESEAESTDINYYVCLVHHAKTLHGCVSNIPANIVKKGIVSFSWLGDTILVMLPGYFLHLLNVSLEFEPCNHVLLHSKTCSDATSILTQSTVELGAGNQADPGDSENQSSVDVAGASWEVESVLPALGLMAEHLVFIGCAVPSILGTDSGGNYVLEKTTGTVYKVCVNNASLMEEFTECYMPMTRLALLHYTILRARDLQLLKQLFSILSNDITSAEVPSLMTEFLIAMTYSSMRRQIDREVLRHLPFTSGEPFRGQFDKTADGDKLARVSYSAIQSVNIVTRNAKERNQRKGVVMEDQLDLLRRHLRLTQVSQARRLNLETVKKAYKQLQAKGKQGSSEEENFGALRLQRARTGSRTGSDSAAMGNYGTKWDTILGLAPPFLHGNFITESSEKLMSLTREVVTKHLSMCLSKDAKQKASNVAKEYVNCQIQKSRLLCHLLWSLRGPDIISGSFETSLNSLNVTEGSCFAEYELWQLLERYQLVLHDVAYPMPQKFPTYLTSLSFKCLDTRMFIQYVDYGVLQLTGDFMVQILTELPNEPENVRLKQCLISRLPKGAMEECYKLWDSNHSDKYFAYQKVGDVLTDASLRSFSESSDSSRRATMRQSPNSAIDSVKFKPLASFLNHLSKVDSRRSKSGWESPIQIAALEEVALHHTTHETNYDMGTVNF